MKYLTDKILESNYLIVLTNFPVLILILNLYTRLIQNSQIGRSSVNSYLLFIFKNPDISN